ncbi:MAG: YHS domain-containing protein, partial [Alphaproteobacteria bacterium]|nr:YHS domain-containing protein [Alphaproteobacteria bacterium]
MATKDPVCGMTVEPATAKHRSEHADQTYFFCSGRCRERFEEEPTRYLAPTGRKHAQGAATGEVWTCPMHPQVQRAKPGSCPICGMALEPVTPFGSDKANPELRDITRRFWVCVGLAVPLLALAMAADFSARRSPVWLEL